MQESELGFGDIVEDEENQTYSEDSSFTNIKTLLNSKRDEFLHNKGYVFTMNYDGVEKSIFFSSDQTLGVGDYRSLTRCRVMHKSRRIVRRALLPRVHADEMVNVATGCLSASVISEYQNLVIKALDLNMVEPGTTKPQISGRSCTIPPNQNILENDGLDIDYTLIPKGITGRINVTEGFAYSI